MAVFKPAARVGDGIERMVEKGGQEGCWSPRALNRRSPVDSEWKADGSEGGDRGCHSNSLRSSEAPPQPGTHLQRSSQ